MDEYIKTTSINLQEPALSGDVGYNLPSSKRMKISPGQLVEIPTGIHVELPKNTWGLILARSSANVSGKLLVFPGVVDEGFRGEITIIVRNLQGRQDLLYFFRKLFGLSDGDFIIEKGQSVAQLVLFKALVPKIYQVSELSESERGSNAFGSTGHK